MFNTHDISRNACQLFGVQAQMGYDWWWHSFTGYDVETGAQKSFFIEFFVCNPALGEDAPVFGQKPGSAQQPSYLMVKAGAWGGRCCAAAPFLWVEFDKVGLGGTFLDSGR